MLGRERGRRRGHGACSGAAGPCAREPRCGLVFKGGFLCTDVPAAALAVMGREQFNKGELKGALDHAHAALQKDGKCVAALVLLGEIALARGRGPFAENLLTKALALLPRDRCVEALLGEALRVQGKLDLAAQCFKRVLRDRPRDLKALLGLAFVRTAENEPLEAELLLRRAVKQHPSSSQASQELGNCLKRRGAILEALGWHRKALGYADPIRLPERGKRRRALFVVQHPSTWSSMASIVTAFRGDPGWETTLVALPYNHPYFADPSDRNAIFGFLRRAGPAVCPLGPVCTETRLRGRSFSSRTHTT